MCITGGPGLFIVNNNKLVFFKWYMGYYRNRIFTEKHVHPGASRVNNLAFVTGGGG